MRFCSASNGDAESGIKLGVCAWRCLLWVQLATSGNVFSNAESLIDEPTSTVVCRE